MTSEPGTIIRIWRKMRELNQRDAAALAGISTRHQSFVENGRTRASAETLKSIAKALYMPEGDKNKLLVAAGFAPEKPLREGTDEELARAKEIFAFELDGSSGHPAFAASDCWELVDSNKAFDALIAPLSGMDEQPQLNRGNFAHLVFHPAGLRNIIVNWHVFSAFFMLMMRAESLDQPANHRFHKLIDEVHPWSEDQNGADIVEPFTLSAIALPARSKHPTARHVNFGFQRGALQPRPLRRLPQCGWRSFIWLIEVACGAPDRRT